MRIHFIAIGGAIMHSLAIELKNMGHIISGSDDVIYEPAKSNLLTHDLLPMQDGWDANNITTDLDMVIIGMHAKLDNPELLLTQKLNIPLLSFPEFVFKYARDKKRVVIAGSHGKTTITSMILHVLNDNNICVDYLLGAKIDSITNLVNLKNNNIILIEGDEYFSSALDHTSKFMHYHPDLLVVSGVSWDHVNVFPTLESYQNTFRNILNNVIENNGKIFYAGDDVFLSEFMNKEIQINSFDKMINPYYLPQYEIQQNKFFIVNKTKKIPLYIFGKHNLYNIEAAKSVCLELGVSDTKFYTSMESFKGADKRLSLIHEGKQNSSIYYDFAHSPSKVFATINAVKELYPNRYLIACLQLYTFSSLKTDFIPQYADVFQDSDQVWIYIDELTMKKKNKEKINSEFLLNIINHDNVTIIKDKNILIDNLNYFNMKNTNLLLMSSGNFSGLDMKSMFQKRG